MIVAAVLALFAFVSAFRMILRERRKNEARREEQKNWDAILDRLNSDECARAAHANHNFEWRD